VNVIAVVVRIFDAGLWLIDTVGAVLSACATVNESAVPPVLAVFPIASLTNA
jgi:hypothetical protein